MGASLILPCSLKTYLSFENLETFLLESRGCLIHLFFFSGGHLSTHCFKYLKHFCVHFFSSSFFSLPFFMNSFCIAPCLFSAIKLSEITTRTWSIYLVDGKPNKHVFDVHSQCRSRTFLGGSR